MLMRRILAIASLLLLLVPPVLPGTSRAQVSTEAADISLPGLERRVRLITDRFGVPHIYARSDADAYFMMGYVHARDRFFQMDVSRRQGSGTLAELLGPGPNDQTLNSDVQLRTLGLRRAAAASRTAYSPEAIAVLRAYANGVNAWLEANQLPPEYAALELTKAGVPQWEIIDSLVVAKLIAFGLSFDNSDLTNTATLAAYQRAGQATGFDGTKLFFDDLFRSAPFDPTVSIYEPQITGSVAEAGPAAELIKPQTIRAASEFLKSTAEIPLLDNRKTDVGSNWWVVSGEKTDTGFPMLANDPHLSLGSPAVFYEIHQVVRSGRDQEPMNVYGVSFPGAPGIAQGFNNRIAWGSTSNPLDVTDFYQEQVIINPITRLPTATRFREGVEPLRIIPEIYRVNQVGDGAVDDLTQLAPGPRPSGVFVSPATFVVPRRNNGPLITAPTGPNSRELTAISVQYAGFSRTREVEALLAFARAENVGDFKRGLQFFDIGSQNWSCMDTAGNIAYFTSGELPLREDLQAGTVDGLPPFFVRDGTGEHRNEWIRNDNPAPDQALRFEILPFEELPQTINPTRGYIANANNDPIGITLDNNPLNQLRPGGQGILYLAPGYAMGNRIARIDRLIQRELDAASGGDGTISARDMERIQSDVQLLDAEVLTPYIMRAFAAASVPGAPTELALFARDPGVGEAVNRLANWDFSTPTGIPEGYDRSDRKGERSPPSAREINHSVAATIYSVWRGQALRNTIDATLARVGLETLPPGGDRSMIALRNLLDNFAINEGRGASGLNFFDVPTAQLSPEVERDAVILQSLKGALNLLAGDAFAPAFGGSTNQNDYLWGKLHRIVFRHPLGSVVPQFNIPPGAGFNDLSEALPGVSTDGGFDVVDASSHNPRAASANGFMFGSGPARRFIGEARPNQVRAVEVIPGGASGVFGQRFFGNQLGLWLTNDFHDAYFNLVEVLMNEFSTEIFVPAT